MSNVKRYKAAFQTGRCPQLDNIYGRIVYTKPGEQLMLSDRKDRRLVMVMGPSALRRLQGLNARDAYALVGHTPEYIQSVLDGGYSVKLLLFARQPETRIATWRNIVAAAARVYPDLADAFVDALPWMRTTSFSTVEELLGFKLWEVDRNGPNDPRFMTLERLRASSRTPLDIRRFLYNVVHLTELYTGNGYTLTASGKRGVCEHVIDNKPVQELGDYELLDLHDAFSRA